MSRVIGYLAMFAIVLLCAGFAAQQMIWLTFALRGVLFAVVLIGLLILVIRGIR